MGFQFQEFFLLPLTEYQFRHVVPRPSTVQLFAKEVGAGLKEGPVQGRFNSYAFARPCTVLTRTSRT